MGDYKVARKMCILMRKNSDRDDESRHLHIVMNDPCEDKISGKEDMIILVNCTSIKEGCDYDSTCVLKAGCHEFITKDSYITYRRAELTSAYFIENGVATGVFSTRNDVTDDLYQAILKGLLESKFISMKNKRFIKSAIEQGACASSVS